MINQYIQNIFYHYILSDATVALKVNPDFFDSANLQTCYKYAKEYVIKYHVPPTATQLKELLRVDDMLNVVSEDVIDILYSSEKSVKEYTPDWLFDNATSWAQWKNFLNSLKNTMAYVKLNQDNVSVENVKEIMEHAKGVFNKSCIIEFDDDDSMGSDFWDAASHKQTKLKRSSSGYSFIDLCMDGGYFPGCLLCLVGAPKSGKSLWMQNLCAKSVVNGENNCYISLELPEEMIHSRIGSNLFNIPSMEYKAVAENESLFKEKMIAFKKSCVVSPGAFIVKSFPTSTMSVLDLETYLLAKEEELSTETHKFKFKNVFVDYINIMKNYRNPNSENTYIKIKQLAEDLKAIGIKHGWAIITATQTTRSQYDTTDMTASQVSESVGLGATVDIMLGIIADQTMKANGKYYLKCLYDRVAPHENKRKLFDCNRMYLRIEENREAPIEEVTTLPFGTSPNYHARQKTGPDAIQQNPRYNIQGNSPDLAPGNIPMPVPLMTDTLENPNAGTVVPETKSDAMTIFTNISVTGAGMF